MACGSQSPPVPNRRLHTFRGSLRCPTTAFVLALALGASLAVGAGAFCAQARAGVATGLCDDRLQPGLGAVAAAADVREATSGLHARWMRINCLWSRLEPIRGQYDQAELARLDGLINTFHASGVSILVTVYACPRWASDSGFWAFPPPGVSPGYQPYYPMKSSALADFGKLGEQLARRYAGEVQAMECWNEPNMWRFLYPQRTTGRPSFAAQTYLRMLKAFASGVRRSGSDIRVVAGSTTSYGADDQFQTDPLRFARFLKRGRAARWFDVYSCHPYTPGGSVHTAPDAIPDHPGRTVTLGNLGALLRVFADKAFYITEYGYNTRPSVDFGLFAVSEQLQASYLRRAYAVAARHSQVKVLIWYLVQDVAAAAGRPADEGVYTGLRRADGTRKPSWRAFAALRGMGG